MNILELLALDKYYLIELEESVWVADWDGDPPRTILKYNAKPYKTKKGAKIALMRILKRFPYRKFPKAKVIEC